MHERTTERAPRRWRRGLGVLALVALALDQLCLHALLADGSLLGHRVAPFDPPIFCTGQGELLERLRARSQGRAAPEEKPDLVFDAELGWVVPPFGGSGLYRYDERALRVGASPLPLERTPGTTRILAIGCSFTRGDEVEGPESWPALLHEEPGLEVANLGVGAYGLGQAVLRYEREGAALDSDEVWLGVLPAALPRLLNSFRPLLQHWEGTLFFKPRFELQGDALVLHASPAPSEVELIRLVDDQAAFLAAVAPDAFVRRFPAAYAATWTSPWHWSALGRATLTWREHGRDVVALVGDERWRVPELVVALCERLRSSVERDGSRLRIVVLPSRSDLQRRRTVGTPYWAPIEERARAAGLAWHDLSADLEAAGTTDDASAWMPRGHYSSAGNRRVADLLRALIDS